MLSLIHFLAGDQPTFPASEIGKGSFLDRTLWLMAAVRALAPRERPIRMLELGSFAGWSALALAEAAQRYLPQRSTLLCVDAWTPYASATDRSDHVYSAVDEAQGLDLLYNLFRHNTMQVNCTGVQIDHFRGRTEDVLPYLAPGFDLINIDASHYYADVAADIAQARRLVATGGIICGDDLELPYDVVDRECCDASGDRDVISDPATGLVYHPGVSRAVHEAFGPVGMYNGFWAVQHTANGFRPVRFADAAIAAPRFAGGVAPKHPSTAIVYVETLRAAGPILIYGAGAAGRLARQALKTLAGIDAAGFIDSFRNGKLDGLPVLAPSQALAEGREATVIVASQHWRDIVPGLAGRPGVDVYVRYHVADLHLFRL